VGYAQSRTVPLHWIGIGVILTLLESWNADWTWVPPNILLSLVLIRIARPYVDTLLQNHGWVAFIVVVSVLLALLPIAIKIVDYGAEGWLWALFGLCQRRYLDGISAVRAIGGKDSPAPTLTATDTAGLMRLLACLLAAVVYVWQEQEDFSFPAVHLAVVILGLGVLSISLCLFKRGESRFQPQIASVLRFVGRRTPGNLRYPACRLRTLCTVVPDLSALTWLRRPIADINNHPPVQK
jgi:hypothetical protein